MEAYQIIPLFVVIPLGAAFLISLVGKRIKRFADVIGVAATGLLLWLSLYMKFSMSQAGQKILVYNVGGWVPPFGISMVIDGLSSFILITINLVAFLVALYSVNYMERYTDKPKFFTLFSLMVCGMNGVAATGDIFNLFVFLEIAAISSYALVAFGTEAEELEASFKYALMGSLASAFIFIGIAFLYGFTSTLNMAGIAGILMNNHNSMVVPFVGVLFIMGFGLKSALVPFHSWLPDAHPSAPASISAMLSGILIKVLGVYALIRILFNVIGINEALMSILLFLGALSLIVGVILALSQWDLKRLLAYHSISQIGYVILGIGLATPLGILGGLFHLFNHSIFKSLLFLNSGAVDYETGTRNLKETGGLAKVMPVTSQTNLIASMAIAGIPPFNGFFSKLLIIIACIQKDYLGYALCAIIGSILTLASFMKVRRYVFSGELKEKMKAAKEVPYFMRLAMVSLAFICLVGGLMLLPAVRPLLDDATNVLMNGTGYYSAVTEAALKR